MDDRITKVLNFIEENLSLSHKLDDLAGIACLSSSQFHRLFKQQTNKTPFKFIEEIKLNKAYQLLVEGNVFVYELAEMFGYNDYETFSRAFKKYFNLSPDDLKAISDKVRESSKVGEDGKIFLLTTENLNEENLIPAIEKLLNDMDIKKEDLEDAKIYKIDRKSGKSEKSKTLIKNKFEMTNDDKIWKILLNKND